MITVDLLSPGGLFTAANGNTQELTTTFTTSIGSPTLTCNGASPFVSGDTGKYFQIVGPGSAGVSGTILEGTMTFVSATQVTMSVNATKALAAASAYLIWGNDDSAGMRAFNTWAQTAGDSITLTLGTGAKKFLFYTQDSNAIRSGGFTWNIPNPVTIVGNGPSSTKFFFTSVDKSSGFCAPNVSKSGNGRWGASSIFTAKLDSVSAGSATIRCKTLADAALFTVNTWARIAGLDMQAGGDPPNNFVYEHVYVTAVDTVTTGIITLQSALQNSYLDTWPLYDGGAAGSRSDKGGPATLYALDPGWNVQATFKDLSTNNPHGQSPSKCRDITFDNVTCLDTSGLFPSDSRVVTFKNCNLTSFSPMEVDKMVEDCVFDNTSTNQLFFQSSINRVTIKNNSVISSLNGTPRYLSLESGSTISGTTTVAVAAYGRTDSFTASASTFTGAVSYGGYADNGDGGTGTVGSIYTLSSSGLITMPRAARVSNTTSLWAVPGNRCYFDGRETTGSLRLVDWGPMFTVLTVTMDATNIYVQTDWPYSGGFPTWVKRIVVMPSKYINFASDVTSTDPSVINIKASTAAGYTVPGAYAYASLTGATCGVSTGGLVYSSPTETGGRLVSLKVNVTTPYTGDASALNWGKATAFTLSADGSSLVTWDPRFDLRTTGLRTITPSGVTGSVGADSLSAPVTNAWLSNWMATMISSRDIRSVYNADNTKGPVFTAELIVDQGGLPTAVVPLRLRLRAA